MNNENLTEKNYILYAAKNYNNNNCSSTKEFYDDLERIVYLKRIFNKYKKNGLIQKRLVLNHLIVLYNVFDEGAITRILFLKLNDHLSILKTFLIFLKKVPPIVYNINSININTIDIQMDDLIITILRQKDG
jgi:hypothetical protein